MAKICKSSAIFVRMWQFFRNFAVKINGLSFRLEGKIYPNSVRKAVLQYSLDGLFVKEWPNAYSAGRALKITGIGEACKGYQIKVYDDHTIII